MLIKPYLNKATRGRAPEKTAGQSAWRKEWRNHMEKQSVGRRPEDCGFDRDTWRELQMRWYESELSDPELRELYLDCVEVHVEQFWALGCTEILGKRICTRWSIETTFLQWLKLYLSRGICFEEAWGLAVEALTETTEGRGIAFEDLNELAEEFGQAIWDEYEQSLEWYLDDDIYLPRVEAWTERLMDFGISKDKAVDMAEELISLLREISFELRIRPTDFWVMGGGSDN